VAIDSWDFDQFHHFLQPLFLAAHEFGPVISNSFIDWCVLQTVFFLKSETDPIVVKEDLVLFFTF